MRGHAPTTLFQRQKLELLRTRIAEAGYHIFPVAEWYRQDDDEFLAVPKTFRGHAFFLVRPLRSGHISVRPYLSSEQYRTIRALLESLSDADCLVRWSRKQLRYPPQGSWYEFLTAEAQEECSRLTAA